MNSEKDELLGVDQVRSNQVMSSERSLLEGAYEDGVSQRLLRRPLILLHQLSQIVQTSCW